MTAIRTSTWVVIAWFGMTGFVQAQARPWKVFILAGQSNMAGNGVPSELPANLRESPRNVHFYGRKQWQPLGPLRTFGPEITFGHELAKAWPDRQIGLIKYALGGTSLYAWSPDWTEEGARITQNERNGPLYQNLLQRTKTALEGKKAEIAAVIWMQGGRDAKFKKASENYEKNLAGFIQRLRKDLGRPKLPFIYGRSRLGRGFQFRDVVRTAQERVSKKVPYTKMVNTDDLKTRRDNTHFNTEGQIELGRRFARAYLELVK